MMKMGNIKVISGMKRIPNLYHYAEIVHSTLPHSPKVPECCEFISRQSIPSCVSSSFYELNNDSSEQQQEGLVTLQVQSDLNANSINLDEVPDDTPLGQLLVNFKRFTIFLFI
jgi:hypothetical protein